MQWVAVSLFFVVGCRFDLPEPAADVPVPNRHECKPRAATVPAAFSHVTAPTGPRAGQSCLMQGCHSASGAGLRFAFAGTVYKELSAVTPATGVTVRILRPGNDTVLAEAVTDAAGNFVIHDPARFLDTPYETQVTACGASIPIRTMVSRLAAGDANCNTGGSCHGAGGTQGAVYFTD